MTKTSIIDKLPLSKAVKKQFAQLVEQEQRSEEEVLAELVETSLPDEDYVIEMAREGDAAADAGGLGAAHQNVLRYLAEIASGNSAARCPERTIPY